jgi:hypothetical protein
MPWQKWYWPDWLADNEVRACSLAARGLWMDMLALMWQADPQGHLLVSEKPVTAEMLARRVGESPEVVKACLAELEAAGVFSLTEQQVIFSRRMVREAQKAEKCSVAGQSGGGNPELQRSPQRSFQRSDQTSLQTPSASASASSVSGEGSGEGDGDLAMRAPLASTYLGVPMNGQAGQGAAIPQAGAAVRDPRRPLTPDWKMPPEGVTQDLLDRFQEIWMTAADKAGMVPMPLGASDRNHARVLLEAFGKKGYPGLMKLKTAVVAFWSDGDEYLRTHGRSVGLFRSKIAGYLETRE